MVVQNQDGLPDNRGQDNMRPHDIGGFEPYTPPEEIWVDIKDPTEEMKAAMIMGPQWYEHAPMIELCQFLVSLSKGMVDHEKGFDLVATINGTPIAELTCFIAEKHLEKITRSCPRCGKVMQREEAMSPEDNCRKCFRETGFVTGGGMTDDSQQAD